MNMKRGQIIRQIATDYMIKSGAVRTAGEIRFIKDNGPLGREIPEAYNFNPKAKKPLAKALWSVSVAMGHLISAYGLFTKVKSVSISPDGKLGGKGYIQDIKEMRSNLNTSIETLSGIQDTINDELNAPHWQEAMKSLPKKDQKEVKEMLSDAEDIGLDPEKFVQEEYKEHVEDDAAKKSSNLKPKKAFHQV